MASLFARAATRSTLRAATSFARGTSTRLVGSSLSSPLLRSSMMSTIYTPRLIPLTACSSHVFAYKYSSNSIEYPYVRAFSSGAATIVQVPGMGDSISEGTIVSFAKNVNDFVQQDELICVIETDKINHEIRAPKAGVLSELFAKPGETVYVGSNLFSVIPGEAGKAPAAAPAAASAGAAAKPGKVTKEPTPKEAKQTEPKAAPRAETPAAPAAPVASAPQPAAAKGVSGLRERRVPMSRMRQRIAERLKDSQNTAAMLTTFQEADMHNLIQLREDFKDEFLKTHGVKLGFMSAFVKASTEALKLVPAINATIDDARSEIVYYEDVDISVAVATPKGLVTPVLRDCDRMSFADVEKEIAALGEKARKGAITLEDLSGGTFTISNGGVYGSMLGTPIINPPQSAILGMHGITKRAVVVNDQIVVRPVMYLALTYDHRLIDGREAVTFLRAIKHYIEDPRRLLLSL